MSGVPAKGNSTGGFGSAALQSSLSEQQVDPVHVIHVLIPSWSQNSIWVGLKHDLQPLTEFSLLFKTMGNRPPVTQRDVYRSLHRQCCWDCDSTQCPFIKLDGEINDISDWKTWCCWVMFWVLPSTTWCILLAIKLEMLKQAEEGVEIQCTYGLVIKWK